HPERSSNCTSNWNEVEGSHHFHEEISFDCASPRARGFAPLRMTILFLFILLSSIIYHPSSAHAVCTNPAGVGGDLLYNARHQNMQYCNDIAWTPTAQTGYYPA